MKQMTAKDFLIDITEFALMLFTAISISVKSGGGVGVLIMHLSH